MKNTLLILVIGMLGSLLIFSSCGNPEYDNAIEKADSLYQAKDYAPAKDFYEKALEVKPDEEHPKSRVAEIEKILKELARKKAKVTQEKYNQLISKADKLLKNEKYKNARNNYQTAVDLKPNEAYPQKQITKIDKILAEKEARKNYPYHVIVGCFEVKKNATNYHAKIKNEYSQNSRKFPILNGRMEAVTYKSYKTMSAAYNDLASAQKISPNAWVMRN